MKAKVHFYHKEPMELEIVRIVPNSSSTLGVYYRDGYTEKFLTAESVSE